MEIQQLIKFHKINYNRIPHIKLANVNGLVDPVLNFNESIIYDVNRTFIKKNYHYGNHRNLNNNLRKNQHFMDGGIQNVNDAQNLSPAFNNLHLPGYGDSNTALNNIRDKSSHNRKAHSNII